MTELGKYKIEKYLTELQDAGSIFPGFDFSKSEGELCLLGKGGYSYVYEMYEINQPAHRFALKVFGFNNHIITSKAFWNSAMIQGALCQDSQYIMRAIYAVEVFATLDENGEICEVKTLGLNDEREEDWEQGSDDLLHLQFILTEKLDEIIKKDKFHNAYLSKSDLSEEKEVLTFAMQIGQALLLAHDHYVLHRDIKLENIFWDEFEKCYKLGDFGNVKYTAGNSAETVIYTDGYGAPEIERKSNEKYNETADIYSFGITLYLLLNELKFPGSEGYYSNVSVQYNPEFVFPAPKNSSERMAEIIRRMCNYEAGERYQNMAEVLYDIACLAEKESVSGSLEVLEMADVATETYREEQASSETLAGELLPQDDTKSEKTMSRSERKEEEKIVKRLYIEDSIIFLSITAVLLFLLLKGHPLDAIPVRHWLIWALPLGLVLEALFQKLKEFDIIFGTLLVAVAVMSFAELGYSLPALITIDCVLLGIPGLSLTCGISIGIWWLSEMVGKPAFPDLIYKYDLEWIVLILLFAVTERYFRMRIDWGKTTYIRAIISTWIYDKISLCAFVTGIVLFILRKSNVLTIPDAIERIHLIRTSVVTFVIYIILNRPDGDNHETVNDGFEETHDEVNANADTMDK